MIDRNGQKWTWESFLTAIDEATHQIKLQSIASSVAGKEGRLPKYYATGSPVVGNLKNRKEIKDGDRFASSIIVGVAETKEGLLPIYTCVKPVIKGEVLNAKDEWNKFIKFVERGSAQCKYEIKQCSRFFRC